MSGSPSWPGPLLEATGTDIEFRQSGIARIATRAAAVGELKARVAWQRQQGHYCDWFDAEEVRTRWPWLGPTMGALWAPREATVNPVRLVEGLRKDAERMGARFVAGEVTALERHGDRVVGVLAGERYLGARSRHRRRGLVGTAPRIAPPALD